MKYFNEQDVQQAFKEICGQLNLFNGADDFLQASHQLVKELNTNFGINVKELAHKTTAPYFPAEDVHTIENAIGDELEEYEIREQESFDRRSSNEYEQHLYNSVR